VVTVAVAEENGFLEYLQLQGGKPDLVTKSELITRIRQMGYSLSDRQLTFYGTEGLVPRSVRVGTRAGAYPAIVVRLLAWIVAARDAGVSIEALKELLPVWKFLMRAYDSRALDIGELEYVARQHVTSTEGSMVVPRLVSWVMAERCCPDCQLGMKIIYKNGEQKSISDVGATIGFAIARTPSEDDIEISDSAPRWYASTRLSLGHQRRFSTDPTTVILGIKPNAAVPPDEPGGWRHTPAQEVTTEP
jgi:DNA-binding transcriptional MerR regulator